jgi:urocanase-like protein
MHDAPASSPSFTMPSVVRVRVHFASLCAAAAAQFGVASLAGRLLLIDGLAKEGDALLIAASIAGAASLVLETQVEAIRYCVRNGIVDFAVTRLSEALRILKNEIRKRQPIAVLLEQDAEGALAEIVERGVQPDMLRWASPEPPVRPFIETLTQRGARPLPPLCEAGPDPGRDVRWHANDGGSAVLRQLDSIAGKILPQDDLERQNWVARAPRYLPRALRLERRVAMTEQESAAFLAEVKDLGEQNALAAPVIVLAGGQNYSVGG